tara:strand:- start:325 stop:690 length:366 start_codon:yes stop_codon:yes gene_type:complete
MQLGVKVMHAKNIPSSEARKLEHVNSSQFYIPFDGTAETCPYKVGDIYDNRQIVSIGFSANVYGKSYHIIVERDRTHCRQKYVFDASHDLKFCKPVERMDKVVDEVEIARILKQADINQTA